MPERASTNKATFVAGTNISGAGGPNTGQVNWTFGGQRMATAGSGVNGLSGILAAQIQLGAGRLDTAQLICAAGAAQRVASGLQTIFYDAAVAGTGVVLASGHRVLAVLDPRAITLPNQVGIGLFNSGATIVPSPVLNLGLPYASGLCVAGNSGGMGFTISYTPVVSGPQYGN